MALVGPRPLVLDEDSRIEGWQRSRLQLPPGMTGPWQVFGSARIPLSEMVKIDYLYGCRSPGRPCELEEAESAGDEGALTSRWQAVRQA